MWRFSFLPAGLLVLASLLLNSVFGQTTPTALTLAAKPNRTGDTISLEEREYFGLFSRTKDFAFATIAQDARGGNVTIHYTVPNQPVTSIVIDPTALRDLLDFTNNYEYYAKDAGPKFKPYRLAPLDLRLPLKRYEYNGRQAEVYVKGKLELGEIFYVTDSTIALWMLDIGYDWEFAKANVAVFRFSEIEKIYVSKRVPFQWIGLALGGVAALAIISTGNHFPDLGDELASDLVMVPGYAAAGFGLGYAVENLFRFKKKYYLSLANGGKMLTKENIDALKKRAMFPGLTPPEFAK